jgi:hypothetical protein
MFLLHYETPVDLRASMVSGNTGDWAWRRWGTESQGEFFWSLLAGTTHVKIKEFSSETWEEILVLTDRFSFTHCFRDCQ